MPDLYTEFRQRHPDHQDWSDDDIYKNLVDPTKFKRAFPDHQDWSDADILRNVQRFAPKGFEEKSIIEKVGAAFSRIPSPGEMLEGLQTPLPKILGGPSYSEAAAKVLPESGQQGIGPTALGKQAVGVAGRTAAGVTDYLTSPLGAASAVVAAAFPPAAPLLFGAPLAKSFAETGVEAVQEGLSPERAERLLATGAMGALVGAGGVGLRGQNMQAWRQHFERQGMSKEQAARAATLAVAKRQTAPEAPIRPAPAPPPPTAPRPPTPLPQERLPTEPAAQQAQVLKEAAQRTEQASGISVVPRQQDLIPITQQRLGSPSVQWSKVSPAAGEIAHATIRATQNLARDTASAIEEFHGAWRPLSGKEAETVIRLLDDPTITPSNFPAGLSQAQTHAYNWTRNYLTDQLAKINEARKTVGEKPITGFREGYFPHVFRGDWTITKYDAATKKWAPIDSPKIGWLKESQTEAIQAAKQYFAENPGTRLKVELKQWHVDPVEATALSRPAFFRLVNQLKSENVAEIDPLSGEVVMGPRGREGAGASLKGVAYIKRPSDPAFGHIKPRESNLPGWMRTPEGLEMMIRGGERYVQMLPLRHEVARLRERVQAEAPQATRLQGQVDSYIDAAVLGKPDALTRDINVAWEMVGERLGLKARPGALQRLAGTANSIQAFLKLGYSPVTALVNMTQVPINVYPVLGGKWTLRGYRDYARGRNHRVLDELGIRQQASKAEEARLTDYVRAQMPRTLREVPRTVRRAAVDTSLTLFRFAEESNRSVTALGAYARARSQGKVHKAAIEEARDLITRTQFVYGPADAPFFLRPAWTRIPGQFKTFLTKEMEFILNLQGKGEIARFAAALTATTGAVGIPGAMLIDQVGDLLTGHSYLREAKVAVRDIPGVAGLLSRFAVGGAGMAAGVDITANVGFQEFFSPGLLEVRNMLGPTGSDLYNLLAVGLANPGRERSQAGHMFLSGLSPSARRTYTVLSRPGAFVDPKTGQTIINDLTPFEVGAILMGFTPNRVAQERDFESAIFRAFATDRSLRGGFLDHIAVQYISLRAANEVGNDELATQLRKKIQVIAKQAIDAGVGEDIIAAGRTRAQEMLQERARLLQRRAPRRLRPRLQELRPRQPTTPEKQ